MSLVIATIQFRLPQTPILYTKLPIEPYTMFSIAPDYAVKGLRRSLVEAFVLLLLTNSSRVQVDALI